MTRALGLALLAVGIVLIIWGINASESFISDVSRFFTGQPTDRSMWLTLGGIAATIFGTVLSLLNFRGSPKL